jgi:tubulin--tyrosine ligase
MTSQNGIHKSYWFEEGYIRTSSTIFTLKNLSNKMIHLTNDAIQKKSEEYGKFEGGNKVLFFYSGLLQRIRKIFEPALS